MKRAISTVTLLCPACGFSDAAGYKKTGCCGRGDINSPERGMGLPIGGEGVGQVDTVFGRISISRQDSDQQEFWCSRGKRVRYIGRDNRKSTNRFSRNTGSLQPD